MQYRFLFLKDDGQVQRTQTADCINDEHAHDLAVLYRHRAGVEVWRDVMRLGTVFPRGARQGAIVG
jgi:hypothetical protein